jgi:hypothetical protein
MTLFAHAGHVLVDMLYALPLFVMVGLLLVGKMREKRARANAPSDGGGNPPTDRVGKPAD